MKVDSSELLRSTNIVITGASGFIGANLCNYLTNYDTNVFAFIREQSSCWRLNEKNDKINIIRINFSDKLLLKNVISEISPNFIFHFAIPPHSKLITEKDLQDQKEITSQHLNNLFYACYNLEKPLTSFIHACSGSVYKWSDGDNILKESSDFVPATLRGKLKLHQLNVAKELATKSKVHLRIARIFRAYGPYEDSHKLIVKALDAWSRNVKISLGENQFKRDYIYIDDLLDGLILLATSELPSHTEINFGSGLQYNPVEIINTLEEVLNESISKSLNSYAKNKYDQGEFSVDISQALNLLNWTPATSLKEGLSKTVQWYIKHLSNHGK